MNSWSDPSGRYSPVSLFALVGGANGAFDWRQRKKVGDLAVISLPVAGAILDGELAHPQPLEEPIGELLAIFRRP